MEGDQALFLEALTVVALQCSHTADGLNFDYGSAIAAAVAACTNTWGDETLVMCVRDARRGKHGRTWLMAAAVHNDLALLRRLCDAGADVNLFMHRGDTGQDGKPMTQGNSLMLATAFGHGAIVRELLVRGADATAALLEYRSGGYRRRLRSQTELVRDLCNAPGVTRETAVDAALELRVADVISFHFANAPEEFNTSEIMEQLLDHLHETDDEGAAATLRAYAEHPGVPLRLRLAVAGETQNAAWLRELSESDWSSTWFIRQVMLKASAAAGAIDLVRIVLSFDDCNVNWTNVGQTAIGLAARFRHTAVVELFAERADICLQDALLAACECNLAVLVGRLIARGADVNDSSAENCKPLRRAIEGGDSMVDVVRVLCSSSAAADLGNGIEHEVEHEDAVGLASGLGHVAIVRVLLEEFSFAADIRHGPIAECCNALTTPLMRVARGHENVWVVDASEKLCRKKPVEADRLEIIRLLVENGSRLSAKNASGKRACDLADSAAIRAALHSPTCHALQAALPMSIREGHGRWGRFPPFLAMARFSGVHSVSPMYRMHLFGPVDW